MIDLYGRMPMFISFIFPSINDISIRKNFVGLNLILYIMYRDIIKSLRTMNFGTKSYYTFIYCPFYEY